MLVPDKDEIEKVTLKSLTPSWLWQTWPSDDSGPVRGVGHPDRVWAASIPRPASSRDPETSGVHQEDTGQQSRPHLPRRGIRSGGVSVVLGTLHVAVENVSHLHDDRHISPICLPEASKEFEDGEHCFVTGWGKDQYGIYLLPNVPYACIMYILTPCPEISFSTKTYSFLKNITVELYCQEAGSSLRSPGRPRPSCCSHQPSALAQKNKQY